MKTSLKFGFIVFLSLGFNQTRGQNLLNIADSVAKKGSPPAYQEPTWKDTRLINAQTTKTAAPKSMIFRIMHRFGDMGTPGGGFHTLYGFDVASDIYFSFEFGITKNLEIGFGRSMQQELLDGMIKYRLLTQKTNEMPVSLAFYGDEGVTPELNSVLYANALSPEQHFNDRLSYISELILDRRFNKIISLELLGGLSHRNYLLANINPNNGATDQSNIPYTGAGGKFSISKHSAIVFDYYYTFSAYRTNSTTYSNAFSIGYEVETGGHVFEINLSNATFINENNIIPNTPDSWLNGGFKLGFSISRAFGI